MGLGAGQIVNEDDLQGKFPLVYPKAGSTARNTTTTYAADPELSAIPLEEGTYNIELILFYTVASTTPKLKTKWVFSGTWTSFIRACHGPGNANVANPEAVTPSTFRGYSDSQDAVYDSSTSAAYSSVTELAYNVVVTAAGDLSLHWAQSVSNGSNVTVQSSSAFRVIKIA